MGVRGNLLSGISASLWIAALNFLATPFYLKFLGVEAYGLIGLYIAAQALLIVLDMGLGPMVTREIARDSAKGKSAGSRVLLVSLDRIYWVAAVLFLAFGTVATLWLSDGWFVADQLPDTTIEHSLLIMVVLLTLRWPLVLYQSTLIGADRLAWVGVINALMATASVASALVVMAAVSATLEAFFLTQTAFAALHVLTMRAAAWHVLGGPQAARFDLQRLRQVGKFAGGTGAIALTSVVFTQLDKLIISKLAGLESFGYYALAVAATSAVYLIVSPVFNVIYPKMSAQVAGGRLDDMERYYLLGSKLLAFVVLPIGITVAYHAQDLVLLWTRDIVVAEQTAPLLSLLVIGSSLHAMMFFPYGVQLALGNTRMPLLTNLGLMLLSIPALVLAVLKFGALGGAMTWLGLQATYLLVGSWLTHHYLLAASHWRWLVLNLVSPLLGIVTLVHVSEHLIAGMTDNTALRVLLAATVGAAIVAGLVASSGDTREGAKLLLLGAGTFRPIRFQLNKAARLPMIIKKLSNYLWDTRNFSRVNIALAKGAIGKHERQIALTAPLSWEFSGFSQNGEDGILDVLRRQLVVSNRYFVEIGSADGVENNTAWLAVAENYAGLMLDGNSRMVERANRVVTPYGIGVQSKQLFVTRDNIATVSDWALEHQPDVFSLDIDGNDYYIAEAIFRAGFRPGIFVVEYNSVYGPEQRLTINYEPEFSMVKAHPSQLYYGVSIGAWRAFFEQQGYRFVTVDRNGVNAFFVDPQRFDRDFLDGIVGAEFNENLMQYTRFGAGHEVQFKLIDSESFQQL